MKIRSPNSKPVVFFDGACPLCKREIAHYRRNHGAEKLSWVDIARDPELALSYGLEFETAMARFHLLDTQGKWHTGAWGFAELWSHLTGYRWLAVTLRRLHLLPLLDKAYSPYARWRLRRSCVDGACGVSGH